MLSFNKKNIVAVGFLLINLNSQKLSAIDWIRQRFFGARVETPAQPTVAVQNNSASEAVLLAQAQIASQQRQIQFLEQEIRNLQNRSSTATSNSNANNNNQQVISGLMTQIQTLQQQQLLMQQSMLNLQSNQNNSSATANASTPNNSSAQTPTAPPPAITQIAVKSPLEQALNELQSLDLNYRSSGVDSRATQERFYALSERALNASGTDMALIGHFTAKVAEKIRILPVQDQSLYNSSFLNLLISHADRSNTPNKQQFMGDLYRLAGTILPQTQAPQSPQPPVLPAAAPVVQAPQPAAVVTAPQPTPVIIQVSPAPQPAPQPIPPANVYVPAPAVDPQLQPVIVQNAEGVARRGRNPTVRGRAPRIDEPELPPEEAPVQTNWRAERNRSAANTQNPH